MPRIPRVSIIVPFQRDEVAFEETLISVLEHQPAGCEVVVSHNGTYNDPHHLGDEVRFVVARSSNLVDLVRDGFDATTSQFVHVMGTGLTAQAGWLSHGLDSFDDSHVGAVTPLVRCADSGHSIMGWSDVPGRLCQPRQAGGFTGSLTEGCYLNAGFFRRTILRGLLDAVAPAMNQPIAVGYAFGCLLERAGWQVNGSKACQILARSEAFLADESHHFRGQQLAAIRNLVLNDTRAIGPVAVLKQALVGDSSIGEAVGYLRQSSLGRATMRLIDPECVPVYDIEASILKMPTREQFSRRAAA